MSHITSRRKSLRLIGAMTFATILAPTMQTALAEKIVISNYKLRMVDWGQDFDGDEAEAFDAASLKGKVVIVEEFGVKIPESLERLKDLSRLQKKFTKDKANVAIVAIHRQSDVADADVLKATKKARVNFPLRKNGFLPASIGGMPHAAIFLPDGSMAWHGDSTERDFDKALKKVLEETSP